MFVIIDSLLVSFDVVKTCNLEGQALWLPPFHHLIWLDSCLVLVLDWLQHHR